MFVNSPRINTEFIVYNCDLTMIKWEFWDYINDDYDWPVPHIILAYHSYIYHKDWSEVFSLYFLTKIMQLLLYSFSFIDLSHDHSEIIDHNINNDFGFHDIHLTQYILLNINFKKIFIGGGIQTLMGIILAYLHVYMCEDNTLFCISNHISFWKCDKYINYFSKIIKHDNIDSFFHRYGLNSIYNIFGMNPKCHMCLNSYSEYFECKHCYFYKKWNFRYYYWKRMLQLFFLGTPCLIFYDTKGGSILNYGLLFYGFITLTLLFYFRIVNEKDLIDLEMKKFYSNVNLESFSNYFWIEEKCVSHNQIYFYWIFTTFSFLVCQLLFKIKYFYACIINFFLLLVINILCFLCTKKIREYNL